MGVISPKLGCYRASLLQRRGLVALGIGSDFLTLVLDCAVGLDRVPVSLHLPVTQGNYEIVGVGMDGARLQLSSCLKFVAQRK